MPLFEVAILEKPTEKEAEDGQVEKLILKPTAVIASDIQSAGIVAVLDNEGLDINRDRMQVIVRPFN